jgi:hypothetical protein
MDRTLGFTDVHQTLSAHDLLAGSGIVHDIRIPQEVLTPGQPAPADGAPGLIRMRPLSIATLTLISRAAREDPGLVPLLMIKEALVEPSLTLDQVRAMHVGLVHYLVSQVNLISGLSADGDALGDAASSAIGQTHLLLAKHFGWSPQQVSQLTPGQVAVYLAGIEQFLRLEGRQHDGRDR